MVADLIYTGSLPLRRHSFVVHTYATVLHVHSFVDRPLPSDRRNVQNLPAAVIYLVAPCALDVQLERSRLWRLVLDLAPCCWESRVVQTASIL